VCGVRGVCVVGGGWVVGGWWRMMTRVLPLLTPCCTKRSYWQFLLKLSRQQSSFFEFTSRRQFSDRQGACHERVMLPNLANQLSMIYLGGML
jgi:hypothetical protein